MPANYPDSELSVEVDSETREPLRPCGLTQSVGLVERPCTEAEVLHFMLQSEAARQDLERSTQHLKNLLQQSAHATREAQSAVRNKSEFLAIMSHEMRTPLNGIIGMTSVLLSRELPPQERECVETIRTSGEALLAVIDDLLDFAKIEAGRLELECINFQPKQVIQQALQIVRGAADAKSLGLRTEILALPPTVSGDMVRFRQVLLNLLSNAIKFTISGEIELKAEVASASETGYELRISITDTGIGISEQQQQKLFQPFTQAEASITRRFGGTGLGLSISKQIVELMGGTIGVHSRPGEGSTFWFTVKVRQPEHKLTLAPEQETAAKPVADSDRPEHHMRVLLVEDNPLNQKVALAMLQKLGYTVELANDGTEALKMAASDRYDLILMDCRMPEMDGFEATRRLRSQAGHWAQVPIVAMTAGASIQDREACFAAGMTDYLAKPVREADLSRKLQHWLSGTGRQLGQPPLPPCA